MTYDPSSLILQLPTPPAGGPDTSWARKLIEALQAAWQSMMVRLDSLVVHGAVADRPTADGSRRVWVDPDTSTLSYDAGSTYGWVNISGGGGGGLTNLDGGYADAVYGAVTGIDGGTA